MNEKLPKINIGKKIGNIGAANRTTQAANRGDLPNTSRFCTRTAAAIPDTIATKAERTIDATIADSARLAALKMSLKIRVSTAKSEERF